MHREQVARVAAHDDIRLAGRGQRQVFVVLWVPAFPRAFDRLHAFGGENPGVENELTPLDGDETIKLPGGGPV
jgi:hypothetical protein